MKSDRQQILVTGGTGYIGSHTVVELIDAGYEPVIIDNLSNSREDVLVAVEKITGKKPVFRKVEMCDRQALEKVFEEFPGFVGVIHFAAFLQVKESTEKPLDYYENNILSTTNLIRCMVAHRVNHLVFSSSCTVYGNPDTLPVNENERIKPAQSPYGNTKKIGEEIIKDSCLAYPLKAISLRYFNPIGAHPTALIGEVQHAEPHHLVPYITETAIGKRKELKVFGGDYATKDGSCVRDFIHVVDISRAHVSAVERLIRNQSEEPCEVFNLGSGSGYTVLEMIKTFEEVTGIRIPHVITGRRPGDVEAVYADISKAKEKLHWEPRLDLYEMLRSAWEWEKAQQ